MQFLKEELRVKILESAKMNFMTKDMERHRWEPSLSILA